jgi:hypothetical protein
MDCWKPETRAYSVEKRATPFGTDAGILALQRFTDSIISVEQEHHRQLFRGVLGCRCAHDLMKLVQLGPEGHSVEEKEHEQRHWSGHHAENVC